MGVDTWQLHTLERFFIDCIKLGQSLLISPFHFGNDACESSVGILFIIDYSFGTLEKALIDH